MNNLTKFLRVLFLAALVGAYVAPMAAANAADTTAEEGKKKQAEGDAEPECD